MRIAIVIGSAKGARARAILGSLRPTSSLAWGLQRAREPAGCEINHLMLLQFQTDCWAEILEDFAAAPGKRRFLKTADTGSCCQSLQRCTPQRHSGSTRAGPSQLSSWWAGTGCSNTNQPKCYYVKLQVPSRQQKIRPNRCGF